MTASPGRPSGGGRPATLGQLIQALTDLPALDPAERFRRCPDLLDAAKAILADERAHAGQQATDRTRPGWVTQQQLADDNNISLSAVTKVLGRGRPARAPRRGETQGGSE